MIESLEERLSNLAAKQGAWSLTVGDPRTTFYSQELLPLWEVVEALQQTKGEAYQYVELAGSCGYFSAAFVESRFVVVSSGECIIAEVADIRRLLQKAETDRGGLSVPKTTESLELFFMPSPVSPSSGRTV
jgi:hypothetical protein